MWQTVTREQLIEEVAAWRQAAEIRAYVGAVRMAAAQKANAAVPTVEEWAAWALRVAEEGDPVVGRAGC
jgi:hypothetical protein